MHDGRAVLFAVVELLVSHPEPSINLQDRGYYVSLHIPHKLLLGNLSMGVATHRALGARAPHQRPIDITLKQSSQREKLS